MIARAVLLRSLVRGTSLAARTYAPPSSCLSPFATAPWRSFSSSPTTQTTLPSQPIPPQPPTSINDDIVRGVHLGTLLYMKYGIGRQRLEEIYLDVDLPIVIKWQRCMEIFLGVQLHVLAGLGYSPDEMGLSLYNQQLTSYLQGGSVGPEIQEECRVGTRDLWRLVLSTAFGVDLATIEELPIDQARSIMHKVAQRMQDPDVLDYIAKECASIEPSEYHLLYFFAHDLVLVILHLSLSRWFSHQYIIFADEDPQMEAALRHHVVQEALVYKVYYGGSPKSLLEECGFDRGEDGYVRLQLAMANHQNDPLVSQYVGHSMMKILQVAGLAGSVAAM